jgi:hypothetical protein
LPCALAGAPFFLVCVSRGKIDDPAFSPRPHAQTADVAYELFSVNWEAAVKAGSPNLRKVLWKTFGKDLMLAGLWKLLWSLW